MRQLSIASPFGAPVFHEETVSSTMDIARVLAKQNEAHGTVITADFQEAGRGRQSRRWSTERGKNLLFTILLRYEDIKSVPAALTLRTGLAVSIAIEDLAPSLRGSVFVKWPNDIMVCFRKIAGILTESDGRNVCIGVGVNVAQTEFPDDCRSKAGSIIQAQPNLCEDARFTLLERILARLHEEIEIARESFSWRERLTERLYKKGEMVTFISGAVDSNSVVEGMLSGIGSGGELLIIPKGENIARAFVNGELKVY